MMSSCDQVTERVALGEPLAELAAHVASCASCQRLVEMPDRLGAARHAIDPGLGFSARMTIGAQHRIAVRRRRRIVASLAATAAASALGVFVLTRSPEPPDRQLAVKLPAPTVIDNRPADGDEDLQVLVRYADTQRSSRVSARWGRIEKPLAPYKKLVRAVTQE
ncbi:MAG TPA: hypothetical protein VFQ53_33995 [Kofleriaceae bacterium]|nr:hypothetical protein [Kofleriaceae bacterium]